MKEYTITLIPGDGTGPELIESALIVIESAASKHNFKLNWIEKMAGESAIRKYGTPLPEDVIESVKATKVALKGPITTPVGTGFRSVNVAMRKALDLYVNLRPARTLSKSISPLSLEEEISIFTFRENTEDLYAGIEFFKGSKEAKELINWLSNRGYSVREDSAISLKPISVFGSERIVRAAFEYARKNPTEGTYYQKYGKRKVTAVHKANIMKASDGLFLEVARKIAQDYPEIEFEDKIVDNMAMQLVKKPQEYDILVMPNLYGDILSDLASGLVGGLGVAPGANIGDECALFEPVHGSAPKYAGQKKVNPTATILAGALMLEHIGEKEASRDIWKAVKMVIEEGKIVTYDLGGNASTDEMAREIARRI